MVRFMMKLNLALVTLFLPFLFSCTLFSGAENKEESTLSKEDEKKLAEYKAEVILGRDMGGRLLQYYGTYGNEDIISYVNQVGSYVASVGDFPERKYMFAILDTDSVNAFACPGGYILVTKGALELAETEAELAMILGHEIAHVGLQHMYNTLKKMGDREIEKEAEEAAEKGQMNKTYASEVRRRPEADNSASAELISRYLSQSAGAGMTLLKAAKAGMNVLLEKGLDQKLEFEADEVGVSWAIRAGYEPFGMLRFLNRLSKNKKNKKNKKGSSTEILDKTHPKVSDRKARIKKLLANMNAKEIVGAKGNDRFDKTLKPLKSDKKSGK